ncbi:MAG: hypothetical protein ACK4E3_11840 [Brevundimonas sp.]|uniref:hypothetical protein n=1 Tax=Brevundimonas sp. TaxID=1871086 RepID=UPI00391A11CA
MSPLMMTIALTCLAALALLWMYSQNLDPERPGGRRRRLIRADNTVPRARRFERWAPFGVAYDVERIAHRMPGRVRHHLARGDRKSAVEALRRSHPGIARSRARSAISRYEHDAGAP